MPKQKFIIRKIHELRTIHRLWQENGYETALIPTMGALHKGHTQLFARAKTCGENIKIIASIFVNPTQFAPSEDFENYPRDEKKDIKILKNNEVDAVFIPSAEDIYPQNFATNIIPGGVAKVGLEDKYRPHFFAGVAIIVTKLILTAPHKYAVFGEKDYQQLLVIRQTVKDLNINTKIIAAKTEREKDGLACSSRNAYLTQEQRKKAPLIYQTLQEIKNTIKKGENPENILKNARQKLKKEKFTIDYLTLRNGENLRQIPPNQPYQHQNTQPARLLIAAKLDNIRLIDNIAL